LEIGVGLDDNAVAFDRAGKVIFVFYFKLLRVDARLNANGSARLSCIDRGLNRVVAGRLTTAKVVGAIGVKNSGWLRVNAGKKYAQKKR
jgi:hypothetical protein